MGCHHPWAARDRAAAPRAGSVGVPGVGRALLAPSERSQETRSKTQTTLTEKARHRITPRRRRVPERSLVMGADGTSAVMDVRVAFAQGRTGIVVSRLCVEACVSDPLAARKARMNGRLAVKGKAPPTRHA